MKLFYHLFALIVLALKYIQTILYLNKKPNVATCIYLSFDCIYYQLVANI